MEPAREGGAMATLLALSLSGSAPAPPMLPVLTPSQLTLPAPPAAPLLLQPAVLSVEQNTTPVIPSCPVFLLHCPHTAKEVFRSAATYGLPKLMKQWAYFVYYIGLQLLSSHPVQ